MASNGTAPIGVSKNIKQIGRMDLPGGGSVVVENGYAFVGHMDPPHGTSILDIKAPMHPKVVDISNPYCLTEVGYHVPNPGHGQKPVKSNDVYRADNGLLYLIDRLDGLEILESEI